MVGLGISHGLYFKQEDTGKQPTIYLRQKKILRWSCSSNIGYSLNWTFQNYEESRQISGKSKI